MVWLIVDPLAKKGIQAAERSNRSWSRVAPGFKKCWLRLIEER